ncbi:MAG: hypothetical protein ABW223_07205 [Rariglobus sp.]
MNKNAALVAALAVSLSGSVLVWADSTKTTSPAPAKPTPAANSATSTAGTTEADRTQRILEPLPATEPAPVELTIPAADVAAPDPSTSPMATSTPTDAAPVTLAPVVVESPQPVLTDTNVLTTKGAGAAARERQFTGEADRALNTFTLPLVGQTPEQRALEKERDDQRLAAIDDTKRVLATVDTAKPEEASALKKELNEISVRNDLIENTTPSTLRRE